ncbi:MAG TPA: hypothetical protein VH643_32880 [Gemmataceae bacterium]|jgi:hypothetical protein
MKKMLAFWLLAAALLLSANAPARAVKDADVKGAIDRGVAALRRMQGPNGLWIHPEVGATALGGLTLLECGAKPDDEAVQRAADQVRRTSVALTHTYSIALSIVFLDRLGDPLDVPLIESLMVRLLAGQGSHGGWTYQCPSISATEVRRLEDKLKERKELVGRREPPKPREGKRTIKDLPQEIREQLERIERGGALPATPPGAPPGVPGGVPRSGVPPGGAPAVPPGGVPPGGDGGLIITASAADNSNTQFAALALWVGRRHGLPVERALTRLDQRFRTSQLADGGWPYHVMPIALGAPAGRMYGPGSSASMTCAGLLALAIVDGATLELIKERKPEGKTLPDISKDKNLMKALEALGAVIGNPQNLRFSPMDQFRPREEGRVGGRTYYFLWSLERVGVALGLDTFGKKDWYAWGAEILLANQEADGSWRGDYANCGADTCFALLFLRRVNLARDLTAHLKGQAKDPGSRELRGVILDPRRPPPRKMASGIETKDAKPVSKPDADARPADPESLRLTKDLVKEKGARQLELLDEMQQGKGPRYTEALAAAIPKLEGKARGKARDALAERLTRMKDNTLAAYLQDEDAEIRRAAALACAMKDSKSLTPNVIALLRDHEMVVVRAAHAALKEMTGQDFGPTANASREDRDQATLKWLQWWGKKKK